MSTDEQDAILGKLSRERAELKRQTALRNAELSNLQREFLQLGSMATGAVRHDSLPETVSRYFDGAKFLAMLDEHSRAQSRIDELSKFISDAGGS